MNVNGSLQDVQRKWRSGTSSNDDVNMSQSSNDTFPTAMSIETKYLHSKIRSITSAKHYDRDAQITRREIHEVIKTGRTHLRDAVQWPFGRKSADGVRCLNMTTITSEKSLDGLEIALGGTAVGTGLNAPDGFAEQAAEALTSLTKKNLSQHLISFIL